MAQVSEGRSIRRAQEGRCPLTAPNAFLAAFNAIKDPLLELLDEVRSGRARIVHDDPEWLHDWSKRASENCIASAKDVIALIKSIDGQS